MERTKGKIHPLSLNEIEVSIAKLFGIRNHIIVPNVSWGFQIHEIDLFIIRSSGYAIEIEIKRSKADLLSDFKKRHNHKDRQNRIAEFYYAFPIDMLLSCEKYIPDNAGIIIIKRIKDYIQASIYRKANRIQYARPLTTTEQLQVARLGTLRIWKYKDKIIKLTIKNENIPWN